MRASRCTMCGSTAHARADCPKGFVPPAERPCFECGKKGHPRSKCPTLQNGKSVNTFEPEAENQEERIFCCFTCDLEPATDSDGFTVVGKARAKPLPKQLTIGDFVKGDNRIKVLMQDDDIERA